MIALAPPARRGRIMGVYTSVISAGFAAGPLCLLVVGTQGWPPFLVGIVAFVFCGVCLALVLKQLPKVDSAGHRVSVLGFVPLAWLLLFAVVVAAGFEQGVLALLPVYGAALRHRRSQDVGDAFADDRRQHQPAGSARAACRAAVGANGAARLRVRRGAWLPAAAACSSIRR